MEQQVDAISVDPLTPNLWYSVEDEFSPDYVNESGSSNQINLRAQLPLKPTPLIAQELSQHQALSLIKFKMPIVTSAPPSAGVNAVTGNGDLTVVWLGGFGSAQSRWAAGASLIFPTSNSSVGSGKWSAGPAIGYTHEADHWTLGLYTENFFSYAGSSSSSPVAQTKIQPTISYAFGNGWSIGSSDMKYVYNYYAGGFTNAPLGISISKRFSRTRRRLVTDLQAEKNLAHVNGNVDWTLRLDLKWIVLR